MGWEGAWWATAKYNSEAISLNFGLQTLFCECCRGDPLGAKGIKGINKFLLP